MKRWLPGWLMLALAISGYTTIAPAEAGNAVGASQRAKRGDFDRTGPVRCAQERGETLFECTAGVVREGAGNTTVVVTFPNGFARTLHFEGGQFTRANATMSGVGTDTDWRVSDGVHRIRVDDQRYEVPHEMVFGTEAPE